MTTTKPVQPEHASGLPGGVVAAIVISVLAMCSFLAFCLYKKCKHGHSGEIHCTTCSGRETMLFSYFRISRISHLENSAE